MARVKGCVRRIVVNIMIFVLISHAVPLNAFAEVLNDTLMENPISSNAEIIGLEMLNGSFRVANEESLINELTSNDIVGNIYDNGISIWDGTRADSFAGGDGSEENPYQIENAMQLAKLTGDYSTDMCYVLTKDIYLNDVETEEWYTKDNVNIWTPIADFDGVFDGQGHSIYGLYDGSLFGRAEGIIQNINLKESYVFSGCEMESDSYTYDYESYIGGVAGHAFKIIGCSNSGTIQVTNCSTGSSLRIGGIAGYADEIIECSNKGIVSVTGMDSSIMAGGIAGYANVVTKCYNIGEVFSNIDCSCSEEYSNFEIIGGIAGYAGIVTQCCNKGDISANSNACMINVGGIAGCITSGYEVGEMSNCYNTGKISAFVGVVGYSHVGGILGSSMEGSEISNCYDSGIEGHSSYYWGGIVGLTRDVSRTTLINCYYSESADYLVGRAAAAGYGKYTAISCAVLTENEMKQKTSFEGFDFENIWITSSRINGGYPAFAWEIGMEDVEESDSSSPNLWFFVDSDTETLSYNESTGYNVGQFFLNVSAVYMNLDGVAYENCIVTTELPEGLSFSKDEEIRTISETIQCIDETNSEVEFLYPLYITAKDYVDVFDIVINCSADGYENVQTYSQSFEVSLENEGGNIMVWTTEKSLSVRTGDSMWLAFGLYDAEADKFSEWKKMAVVVSDPTIIEFSEYEETQYGYSLEVIGKKQGATNVVITDASTGESLIMRISVYDKYVQTYSYAINNMPSFYPNTSVTESRIKTNIYDLNGLFVNNYSAVKDQNNNKYTVSFDVYNINHYYGAVDIYDQNGNWVDYEEIDKFSYSTSTWEVGEQAYYLVTDFLSGKFQTYELKAFSQHTPIKFKVPENGYFIISNNLATSPGTYFANAFEILFAAAATALDLGMSDGVEAGPAVEFIEELKKNFLQRIMDVLEDEVEAKENVLKIFLKTVESEIRKKTKGVVKAELNALMSSANDMYSSMTNLAEDILSEFKIDWKRPFQTACGIGEAVIEKISGPAGIALDGCFSLSEGGDKLVMAVQMALSTDNVYVTVYSDMRDSYINPNGVIVNSSGNIDAEAVLQVFRISNNDTVAVILDSDNPLETYELYNICFVKNDQLVQPSGKVVVHVPIPEGMNGDTCKIYRQEEDGTWAILDAHIKDNYLVFETEHFSLYAIIGETKNINIYSLPTNTTYCKDDMLNTEGLVVDIDGTLVSEGFICTPNVLLGCGIQKINVIYGSATAEFDVMVNHAGGTATCAAKAVCIECGEEYGERDEDNHVGATKQVGTKVAICEERGYTGDICCVSCNVKLILGEDIPALGHEVDGGWTIDETYHWHVCTRGNCGEKYDIEQHYDSVEDEKCDVCGRVMSTAMPEPTEALKPTVIPSPIVTPKPTKRPWSGGTTNLITTLEPTVTPIPMPELAVAPSPTLTPVSTETLVKENIWFRNQNGELVKSAVLYVGDKMQLYLENRIQEIGQKGKWFSINPEVATVSITGEITVHSTGLAEIYWTSGDKQSERFFVVAEPKPEFSNKETEAAREILLGTSRIDTPTVRFMKPGQAIDLNFYGVKQWKKEKYDYQWASSDESVAVVDSAGNVAINGYGVATVELKLKNKETGEYLNVKSVDFLVPKSKDSVMLGSSKANVSASYTLQRGSKIDLNFYGVKNWKEGDYSYQWTSSDTGVVWVDQKGNVVGVSQGKAVVTLTLINKKTRLPLWVTPVEIEVSEE